MELDLVNRYIAAVQRELPETIRQDIGRELTANIMDQLDALYEQHGEVSQETIAAVLKQLGHPRVVAKQFSPQQPLIKLAYMPLYKNTLFMVLGILFVLKTLSMTAVWLSHSTMGIVSYLHGVASGFIEQACFAFTAITLAFWLKTQQQPNIESYCSADWQPEKLPEAGASWQHISLQTIFTDLATYLFLIMVIWYPFIMPNEPAINTIVTLSDYAASILQWSTPIIIAGVILTLWQLRQRLWSRFMLKVNVVLNALFTIICVYLATISPLIQINSQQLQGIFSRVHIENSALITLLIIALFPAWELVRDLYRLRKMV